MLHNLEWLHDLNVLYDASTFDTDPFEPQPDGVGTIFPFWVPRVAAAGCGLSLPQTDFNTSSARIGNHNGDSGLTPEEASGGYVELPYTLCQDSTLFVLLREPDQKTWCRKLDWIVEHGGMALLNTHPDYMSMGDATPQPWQFPMRQYETFLKYVRSRYSTVCWHVTARELATWYKGT